MNQNISQPNFPAHGNSGTYQIVAQDINSFSIEKYIMPFIIPVLSSLIGAAASYTAIRKDIQVNQERVTKLETERAISEERINDLNTKIAVIEVKLNTLKEHKRRR